MEQERVVKATHGEDALGGGDVERAKQAAQRLVDSGYDGGEGQGAVCDAEVVVDGVHQG